MKQFKTVLEDDDLAVARAAVVYEHLPGYAESRDYWDEVFHLFGNIES